MPRAAFEVEADVISESDRQLTQMLSQHLNRRFRSSPAGRVFGSRVWAMDVELGRKTVTIAVKRHKHAPDLWILMVGPGGPRGVLALLRGRRAIDMSADLLPICREIHAFLTSTSGISQVRWYLNLTGSRTAVATPEELPWGQA
jgi:hypothetical protein